MKKSFALALLTLTLLLQSCLNDGTPGTGGSGGFPPLSLTGQVIACQGDEDCVLVELGCCPSCSYLDGWAASVNKEYEEDVYARNRDVCTGDEVCPDIWCEPQFPVCENGTCTFREEDYLACVSDDDCAVVELGCCDHCNGGWVMAVNGDYADDIEKIYGADCAEDHACTLMGCAEKLARCSAGQCEAYDDPSWGF